MKARGRATFAGTGLAGGLFAGLTGVGGGAIMVPLMTGVLRMRQHAAHGTSLLVIGFAAMAGAATYAFAGDVAWRLVAALLAGSLVGAYAGARLVQSLPAMRLRQLFGLFLLVIGIRMLTVGAGNPIFDPSGVAELVGGASIGLAGGLAAGALGVGGGAIFVPGAVLLLGAGQHEAQGASLAVIVLTALVGAATHYRHGALDVEAAKWIVPTAVPAGILGALAAGALGAGSLQRIFSVVVLGVAVQMLVTATIALRRGETLEPVADPLAAEVLS